MQTDFETPAVLNTMGSLELASDFDELLEESVTPSTPAQSDDLFDLDALLNESVRYKTDAKRIALARRDLANRTLPKEQREITAAMVKEWELKREWTPRFSTIMFDTQECTHCGTRHKHFVGLFQQQEHKMSKIVRWVQSGVVGAFPKNTKENIHHVSICSNCATEQGWQV